MEQIKSLHKAEYQHKADVVAVAPGRFHLIGEHTWFFRDKTLSMAVNLPVYVALSRKSDPSMNYYFVELKERKKSSMVSMKMRKEDKWANAVKSVVYGFTAAGYEFKGGFDCTISSQILPSSGFGITTAIKVAAAWAIRELEHFEMTDEQLIHVLELANRKFLGTEFVKADFYTAIFSKPGHLVLTDYGKNNCDLIPFEFEDKVVMLTDASVPRITTWNEESLQQPENVLLLGELKERKSNLYGGWRYEENAAEINEVLSVVNEDTHRRLVCIMNEHKCVLDAEQALEKKDFASFAKAVKSSHESMRDLYDISCPEIDWILKRVQELDEKPDDLHTPVNCGRITGKGFGRCVYTVLRSSDVEKFKSKLAEYERIFGFKSSSYIVQGAEGVHLL